jgi:hypothetical protein
MVSSAFAGIAGVLWLFVPSLLFALFQSYRLFRAEPRDGTVWMLRCVAPLAVVTMLWSFLATAGFAASTWQPFEETRGAIERFAPGGTQQEVSGAELAKGSAMSSLTARWLEGSSVSIAPADSQAARYRARIRLASGVECRLVVNQYGGSAGTCER